MKGSWWLMADETAGHLFIQHHMTTQPTAVLKTARGKTYVIHLIVAEIVRVN